MIRPDDRHVVLLHPTAAPALADPGSRSFIAAIVGENPVIIAGRVVEKQPVFLNLRTLQEYTLAPTDQANWIGSRLTVLVDRVIQTIDALAIAPGSTVTFVDEGDASAFVNGVRVDTETPWLWPIESRRRYLITGRLKNDHFVATGMWMEPAIGGSMRAPVRTVPEPGILLPPEPAVRTPFDDWNIEQASFFLDLEVQRRADARR
jgi:hypothetical protein